MPFCPPLPFWPSEIKVSLMSLPRLPSGFLSYVLTYEPVWSFCLPRSVMVVTDVPFWPSLPFKISWCETSWPSGLRIVIVVPIILPFSSFIGVCWIDGERPSLPSWPFTPSFVPRSVFAMTDLPSWPFWPSRPAAPVSPFSPLSPFVPGSPFSPFSPGFPFAPSWPLSTFCVFITLPSPSLTVIVTPICLPELSVIGVCSILGVLPSSPFLPSTPSLPLGIVIVVPSLNSTIVSPFWLI